MMLEERGRIVAIERDGIWVETIQRSGCSGCAAKPGCGTGLLGDYWAGVSQVRVAPNGHNLNVLSIHDAVVIGVDENALAGSALIVYLLPLVALLAGTASGNFFAGEAGAVIGATLGLLAGALSVRILSRHHADAMVPQLLRVENTTQVLKQILHST